VKPVKKWSILFCLAVVLATAGGYWFYQDSSSLEKSSATAFEDSFQDEIPEVVQSEVSPTEIVTKSEVEEIIPNDLESPKSSPRIVAERKSAAESPKDEFPKNESSITPDAKINEPQLEAPNSTAELSVPEVPSSGEEPHPPIDRVVNESSHGVEGNSEETYRSVWLSLGTGVSFSSLTQDVPGASELNVGKFSAPFMLLELGAWLSKVFGFELSYQSMPGKVLSSPSLTVSKEEYTWKTLSVEANYKTNYLSADSEWILKAGLQHQEIPFLYPQSASEISLFENSISTLSAGLQYRRRLGSQIYIDSLIRYQYPFMATSVAGSKFDVKSSVILDGEVGASYSLNKNLSLGGFWSVQYLSYRYQFTESSSSPAQNGKQTLIQSNLNLRLRWEF